MELTGTDAAATPPVVLLPGFMQDHTAWDAVRGHLRTHMPDVQFVPTPVEAKTPPVVVGYSAGGRAALEALWGASGYPAWRALVLESASLGPASEDEREALRARNYEWAARIEATESMEEVVAWWEGLPIFATQRALPPEKAAAQRAMRSRCNPTHLAHQLREQGAHTMHLAHENAARLAVAPFPVHYIAGANDAKYSAIAQQLQATSVLPASRIHLISQAGHNTHLEHPATFATLLAQIIQSVA